MSYKKLMQARIDANLSRKKTADIIGLLKLALTRIETGFENISDEIIESYIETIKEENNNAQCATDEPIERRKEDRGKETQSETQTQCGESEATETAHVLCDDDENKPEAQAQDAPQSGKSETQAQDPA